MKRRSLAVGTALLLAFSNGSARPLADASGCAALAERVQAAVSVAVDAYRRSGSPPAARHAAGDSIPKPAVGEWRACHSTATAASRAFSSAIGKLDLKLAWSDGRTRLAAYCRSNHLEDCDLLPDPTVPLPRHGDFAFACQAWQGVRQALASQMPYGSEGDFASFSDDSLVSALAAELSTRKQRSRGWLTGLSSAIQ